MGEPQLIARWPAMMKRQTAAEYCDMSVQAFEKEIFAGRLPTSVMLGGRPHWRKDALDAAFERLSGSDPNEVPEYRREMLEKYGKAA